MANEAFDAGKALLEAELAGAEAKAAALRRVLAARGAGDRAADFVLTADPDFERTTGHKPRNVVEAIRAGKLVGTKVTRGYRVALVDLQAWERARESERRARRGAYPRQSRAADDEAAAIDRALASAIVRR